MPLPVLYDTAQLYLFEDEDKMADAGLPMPMIRHIIRLRESYNFWISHPSKRDRDIVARLRQFSGVSKTQAYQDLRLLKALLGSMQKESRDYHRYRASQGILDAIERARVAGKTDAEIRGWAEYAKIHQLDKEESDEQRYDIKPQPFKATDNPEVIGIARMPDWRQRAKELKEKYWSEDVIDVEAEPVDFDEESIFRPQLPLKNGEEGKQG